MEQTGKQTETAHFLFYSLLFATPILAGGNAPPSLGGGENGMLIWALLVLLVWGFITISRPASFRDLMHHKAFMPFIAFVVWLLINLFFAVVIDNAIKTTVIWFTAMLIPLLAVQLRLTKQQQIHSLIVLLISATLVSVYGMYQALWGFEALKNLPNLSQDDLQLIGEVQRPFSVLLGANSFGGFLLPFIPISILLILNTKKQALRFGFAMLAVLILLGLIFSYSRGAWLCMIFGIIPILLYAIAQKSKKLLIFLLGLFVVTIILFSSMQTQIDTERAKMKVSVMDRVASIGTSGNVSVNARTGYWKTAFNISRDNLMFGTGLDSFGEVSRMYQASPNYTRSPHNIFLKIASELGILGLLMFLLMIFMSFKAAIRQLKHEKSPLYLLFLMTAVLLMLAHGMIDFDFMCPSIFSIFLLLLIFMMLDTTPAISDSGKSYDPALRVLGATFIIMLLFFPHFFSTIARHYHDDAQFTLSQSSSGKALEFATEATSIWPIAPIYHYSLSRILLGSYQVSRIESEYKRAMAENIKAIHYNPTNPEYHLGLADLYAMRGESKRATESVKMAASLYPNSVYYQAEYAKALGLSGNIPAALLEINKALKLEAIYLEHRNPNGMDLIRLRFLRAALLYKQNFHDQTLQEYKNILALLDKPSLVLNTYTSTRPSDLTRDKLKQEVRKSMAKVQSEMKMLGEKPEKKIEQ